MTDPRWDDIPTDEELLLARSVLKRLSRALPVADEPWEWLVESRQKLTITISYLSGFPGHYRHYHHLWLQMLEQDRRS